LALASALGLDAAPLTSREVWIGLVTVITFDDYIIASLWMLL